MEKIVGMWSAGLEWCCCTLLARADDVAALCWVGLTLFRSAPVQGVSRPPHAASRDCRTAHPLPVRSRVRLYRNAGSRGKRNKRANDATISKITAAFLSAYAPAAERVATGGRGGRGGVGADLASAGSMRHPPSPAHPAIPTRLAALRVGAQAEMPVLFASRLHCFACVLPALFLLSRVPAFRCRRTRDRTGKGGAVPTISARSVRRTAHPLSGRGAKQRHSNHSTDCSPLARAQSAATPPENPADHQPKVMPEAWLPPWSQ